MRVENNALAENQQVSTRLSPAPVRRLPAEVEKFLHYPPAVVSDRTIAALRSWLAEAERLLIPAPRELIILRLTRLAAHHGAERPAGVWQIIFEDFANDLADVAADVFEAAIERHRRREKWFPKISELLDYCGPVMAERRANVAKIRALVRRGPGEASDPQRAE